MTEPMDQSNHGPCPKAGALLAGAAALALLAAGCGGAGTSSYDDAGAIPEEDAAPEGSGNTLQVASTDLGEVVTDGDGYTLYLFTADGTEPPVSTCAGDCAAQWPPALAEDGGGAVYEQVEEHLVDTVERDDGADQITLGGWPLYRYAGDVEPGDVNGEGVDDVWFAIAPGGGKAEEAAAAEREGGAADPSAGAGGAEGYGSGGGADSGDGSGSRSGGEGYGY